MITVVTVCLNAEKYIEKTIQSVLKQLDVEVDYIIKDGGSLDATNSIIKNEIAKNQNDNILIKHIVSKDKGIYDAMNQALLQSQGEWIIFMNAGDSFYNEFVLRDTMKYLLEKSVAVVYGHTLIELDKNYSFVQIHSVTQLEKFFSLGHQSCFVKTEIMKQYMFNTDYKIAADYDLFLKLHKDKKIFHAMNIIIASYNREGISAQKSTLLYKETYLIKNGNQGKISTFYYIGLVIWQFKALIAAIFPAWEKFRFCKNSMKRIREY